MLIKDTPLGLTLVDENAIPRYWAAAWAMFSISSFFQEELPAQGIPVDVSGWVAFPGTSSVREWAGDPGGWNLGANTDLWTPRIPGVGQAAMPEGVMAMYVPRAACDEVNRLLGTGPTVVFPDFVVAPEDETRFPEGKLAACVVLGEEAGWGSPVNIAYVVVSPDQADFE